MHDGEQVHFEEPPQNCKMILLHMHHNVRYKYSHTLEGTVQSLYQQHKYQQFFQILDTSS